MKEKHKGSIVFIGSNSALRVTMDRCAYCSSKAAMIAMSKSLAVDWGKYGIRSNVVLPGMIKTERWHNNVNNTKYCLPNYTPIEDIAEFEDVANAAWYFGSDQSRNTTGTEHVVDGGMLAQLTPMPFNVRANISLVFPSVMRYPWDSTPSAATNSSLAQGIPRSSVCTSVPPLQSGSST